jgi:hypothetical protein
MVEVRWACQPLGRIGSTGFAMNSSNAEGHGERAGVDLATIGAAKLRTPSAPSRKRTPTTTTTS